jgi:hypothetical protein
VRYDLTFKVHVSLFIKSLHLLKRTDVYVMYYYTVKTHVCHMCVNGISNAEKKRKWSFKILWLVRADAESSCIRLHNSHVLNEVFQLT